MTLSELLSSPLPDLESLRGLALVFDTALCQRLVNVQAWYGDPRHVPQPPATNDGRWMLCADVLTECSPGGILWGGFSRLDPQRFAEIEVVPTYDITLADLQPPQLVAEEMP